MTKKTEIKKVRCNICSAGCPIDAYVQDGKLLSVEGSRDWPGQQGGLCSKGAASRQYVYNKDRILYPMKRVGERGSGEFERISWEEAYAMIANNLLQHPGKIWVAIDGILCGISEVVPSGAAASGKCIWFSELLYGVQHLFSVGCHGLAVNLWK